MTSGVSIVIPNWKGRDLLERFLVFTSLGKGQTFLLNDYTELEAKSCEVHFDAETEHH